MTEDNQNNFPSLWSTQLIFFSFVLEIFSFRGWKLQMVPYFHLTYSVFSVNFGRMWFIFPMTAYKEMYYFTLLINSALFDEKNILINTCNWEIREVIWNNCQLNRDKAIFLFNQFESNMLDIRKMSQIITSQLNSGFIYSIISILTYWKIAKCHILSYKTSVVRRWSFMVWQQGSDISYYRQWVSEWCLTTHILAISWRISEHVTFNEMMIMSVLY